MTSAIPSKDPDPAPRAPSIKDSTVSGVKWASLSQIGRQLAQIAAVAVLSRLLTPSDFGLIGMALVAVGFLNLFGDLGTTAAIVQKKEAGEPLLSSVFWANVCLGASAMLVLAGGAGAVAAFYDEPALKNVLVVLSPSFFLTGLGAVHRALLQRRMAFRQLAWMETGATLLGAGVGIAAAFRGWGVWSLAAQHLALAGASLIGAWLLSGWRPRLYFRASEALELGGYSLNLAGYNTLNYFSRNADYLLIGKYLGAQNLGYYTLAYRLMLAPLQNVTYVICRVLFPAFSRLQDDDRRLRSAYLQAAGSIAVVTVPAMLGLMAVRGAFVEAFFGPAWAPVADLLLILAPVGLAQSIGATVGVIYQAKGRTDWLLRWGLVSGGIVFAAFAIGLRWGILGVAAAYAVATGLLLYPNFSIPFRLIKLRPRALISAVGRTFWCGVLMAAAVYGARGLFPPRLAAWVALTALTALGAAAYLAVSLAFNRRAVLATLAHVLGRSVPKTYDGSPPEEDAAAPGLSVPLLAYRARSAAALRVEKRRRRPAGPEEALAAARKAAARLGGESFLSRPLFAGMGGAAASAARLKERLPERAARILEEAEALRAHVFDLLGSGPTTVGPPPKGRWSRPGYAPIDWRLDFKSGHRWPMEFITEFEAVPGVEGADVKVPWELSRFHHGFILAKAWALTGDESHRFEFENQLADWAAHNPVYYGVNWKCAMDAAIRAVNLMECGWMFGGSLSAEAGELLDGLLAEHGRFLRRHLEWGRLSNNHLLAGLTGLALLGLAAGEKGEAADWTRFALRRFGAELDDQFLSDGVNFELSPSYHRMTAEFPLCLCIALRTARGEVPARLLQVLEKALRYVGASARPDGTAPGFGDADNGRLHFPSRRLDDRAPETKEWADARFSDHRHLLAVGGAFLEDADMAARGAGWEEEVLWLMGPEAFEKALDRAPLPDFQFKPVRAAFPEGGTYILRGARRSWMAIDAGGVGSHGLGTHSHNDLFSFELSAGENSYVCDSGTFAYTPWPDARNRFRSALHHAALTVDRRNMFETPPSRLFRMTDAARGTVLEWSAGPDRTVFKGAHRGFSAPGERILHERTIEFFPERAAWILTDRVSGLKSEREVAVHFPLRPGPALGPGGDEALPGPPDGLDAAAGKGFRFSRENAVWVPGSNGREGLLVAPLMEPETEASWTVSIRDGEMSPSYGIRLQRPVLEVAGRFSSDVEIKILLAIVNNI